ncbi:MAG TPA: hypothetical protein VFS42_05375 [Burkholderiaceae bacterium]|nr:hypothetical protein [Burkholderiaceae bacterium]
MNTEIRIKRELIQREIDALRSQLCNEQMEDRKTQHFRGQIKGLEKALALADGKRSPVDAVRDPLPTQAMDVDPSKQPARLY